MSQLINRYLLQITLLLAAHLAFAATKPSPTQLLDYISQQSGNARYYAASEYSGANASYLQSAISALNQTRATRNYALYVMEVNDWNAFASAGTTSPDLVCIYTGLINDMRSPDELAGVIAHEIAHNKFQHGAKQQQAQGLAVLLSMVLINRQPETYQGMFAQVMSQGFSRKDEADSDQEGLFLMTEAGFNPNHVVDLWARIARKGRSTTPAAFMSHPPSQDRANSLRRVMRKHIVQTSAGTYRIASRPKPAGQFQERTVNGLTSSAYVTTVYIGYAAVEKNLDFKQLKIKEMTPLMGQIAAGGFLFGAIMNTSITNSGTSLFANQIRVTPALLPTPQASLAPGLSVSFQLSR